MTNLFSLLRWKRRCSILFTTVWVCVKNVISFSDVDAEKLDALDLLHCSPIDVDGGVLVPLFPVVHGQLLCLADVNGEKGCCPGTTLPGDQFYHRCDVRKLDYGVGVVGGHAVVGEE